MGLTKKQIEKLGEAYLAEQFYREGLRFARPDIDDGIDLLVYDWNESVPFRSVPVQMKSFSDEEFLHQFQSLRLQQQTLPYWLFFSLALSSEASLQVLIPQLQ